MPTILSLDENYRIAFVFEADRFRHSIQQRIGSQWVDLWRSIEGTSDEDWPSSPPIQEIFSQELEQGVCLLGVGRAGASHWSISIDRFEPKPADIESPFSGTVLRFDLACRVKGTPGSLGSSYHAAQAEDLGVWFVGSETRLSDRPVDQAEATRQTDSEPGPPLSSSGSPLWSCEPIGTPAAEGSMATAANDTWRWVYYWSPAPIVS